MIKYQKISGVSLEGSGNLPKIERTPEGAAMGAVPGWQILYDPEYVTASEARNRAVRNGLSEEGYNGTVRISELNGIPMFDSGSGDDRHIFPVPGARVNPNAWTAFCVVKPAVTTGPIPRLFRPSVGAADTTGIALNVGWGQYPDGIIIYEDARSTSGNPQRLRYNPVTNLDVRDGPTLLMFTFSTSRGLAIFDGGELVASDPTDVRPLTAFLEPGDIEAFRNIEGLIGMSGLLNIDLSAPENTGHRRAIEKFLMAKYGIPEGPQ